MEELVVLRQICTLLGKLDTQAQKRSLAWLNDKFEKNSGNNKIDKVAKTDRTPLEFIESHHELTNSQKALLAAFHLARNPGKNNCTAREISSLLKKIGYRINNITMALNELVRCNPQKLTVYKSGDTKQAQKLYTLTKHGEVSAQLLMK